MKHTVITTLLTLILSVTAMAQTPVLLHSHNDYNRTAPFWQAYSMKMNSIEADTYDKDGVVLVGHELEDLRPDMSLDALYVQPLVTLFARNGGRPWANSDQILQLMVELKGDTEPNLKAVCELLGKYPQVFDPKVNPMAVRIAITGNVPEPKDFAKWPQYVSFDGDLREHYDAEQLKRVALFSANFGRFSHWNGKGSIIPEEHEALMKAIDEAHSMGKPIRFWGAPEGTTVYYTFYDMGIDYINTDVPEVAAAFFNDFSNKNFCIGKAATGHNVTVFNKLDKATRDFAGFADEALQLSKPIDIYTPTYASDGADTEIRNVIFLIGDGMGLNQITAAAYANKGLSLMKFHNIGIQFNNAANAFTTDSAAGGSALATGEAHDNRHVAATTDGTPIPSLSDTFHDMGRAVGVLTLGDIADATPTAFYGHGPERDDSDLLTGYLADARIDLLCGSGMKALKRRHDGRDLMGELKQKFSIVNKVDKIPSTKGRVICVDEEMDEAAEEANLDLLATATKASIDRLKSLSDKGFFLMVEGAKIDYAGHARCLPGSVIEMLSFDKAIAEALKFADEDGHTLVIVTADHETGGLTLVDGDTSTGRIMGVYISNDHTPSSLPVFSYGPHASSFSGVYPNTTIARRIKALVE